MTRLTSAELEVGQILWESGELKPADIQEQFDRPIKNPALRSILGILVDQGHVTRRQVGKAYFYKAKTKRQSVFRSMMREVADVFCQGSAETLLMNMIKSQQLSEEELVALKRMADEPPSESKPEKGSN